MGKAIYDMSFSGKDGKFRRDDPNFSLAELLSTYSLIEHSYPRNIYQLAN